MSSLAINSREMRKVQYFFFFWKKVCGKTNISINQASTRSQTALFVHVYLLKVSDNSFGQILIPQSLLAAAVTREALYKIFWFHNKLETQDGQDWTVKPIWRVQNKDSQSLSMMSWLLRASCCVLTSKGATTEALYSFFTCQPWNLLLPANMPSK